MANKKASKSVSSQESSRKKSPPKAKPKEPARETSQLKKTVKKKASVVGKKTKDAYCATSIPSYSLRPIGKYGQVYYYLMLECPAEQKVLGVLRSKESNLLKKCKPGPDSIQPVKTSEFFSAFVPLAETSPPE
jgi:hypothetical protein